MNINHYCKFTFNKIKNYWKIYYHTNDNINECCYVVKAKNVHKAIDEFYKLDGSWYLRKGYIVSKVERLEVEVVVNEK